MTNSLILSKTYFKFFLAFVLIYCIDSANAQTGGTPEANGKNSLLKGSWALQFQINDNFTLSSFQGSTISAKRHFSNKRAIRFGMSLSSAVTDQDQSSSQTAGSDHAESDAQRITINTQYALYPSPDKNVNLFFGSGPVVSLSRSNTTTRSLRGSFSTANRTRDTGWSAGLSGVLGVEWFATRNISLSAEYTSSLVYSSSNIKAISEQIASNRITFETERHTKAFQFGSGGVNFGLSIYF